LTDFGPEIYAGLGYDLPTQLALSAAWVSTAFVASALSMLIVDRVPRQKLIAGGMIACVIVLVIECILVARFPTGPTENKPALKAAVAFIFREWPPSRDCGVFFCPGPWKAPSR